MKKILLTILVINFFNGYTQTSTGTPNTKNMFTINVIMPGVQYEMAVTSKTSLSIGLSTGLACAYSDVGGSEYGIFPSFQGAYRYYYNFEKRKQKGKPTDNNSGNYLALFSYLTSGDPLIGDIETSVDYNGAVGPVWGIQRTYKSKLNWNLELGVGYGFNDTNTYIAPIINFSIGWVFGENGK